MRVLYHGFTDKERIKIVHYLYEHEDWTPVYMVGQNVNEIEAEVKKNYRDCILQESMALRNADFDFSKIGDAIPIDSDVIHKLSKFQNNFMGFLPDISGWNFSFEERKRFYYEILKYWNTAITNIKPELIIFFTRPHTSACHSLYLLSKYVFKLKVLFIDPVPFFNENYHFVNNSIEELDASFLDLYRSDKNLSPGPVVKNYLDKLRSHERTMPNHIMHVYSSQKGVLSQRLMFAAKLFISTCFSGIGFKKAPVDWKKNMKPYYSSDSKMNNIEHALFLLRLRRNNLSLKKYYESLCYVENDNDQFIYFTAPYQPEAVSSINGGVYEDILLVVDMLMHCLPNGWVLYYKEHPGTFLEDRKGSLKKNKEFYNILRKHDRLKFISTSKDTFDLLDKSKAVVTISGTVAWEAVVRGIPSISFGNSWYQNCDSIFHIKSLEDLSLAINSVNDGFEINQEDIERFAASIEQAAIPNMLHRNFNHELIKSTSPEKEVEKIALSIKNAFIKFYSEPALTKT